jgi:diguanylate cyclase
MEQASTEQAPTGQAPPSRASTEQALTSRRFLGAVGVVVLVTGVAGVWIGLGIGGTRVTLWVDDGVTPLAALAACVLCFRARARHVGRMRLFWTLLGCATASWTLAEVIWGYYALILDVEVPVPSWADVGYLSAIPLAIAALVVHPATRGSGTRKARSVFDGLVIATALMFLSWTLVLGPVWRSADLSTWTGVVTLAYPFGDVVIVFFIVLAIRGMTGRDRLSLWCLLAALLVMALSDSTFAYLTDVTTYTSPGLIDTGWIAAYLGIALAAFGSRPSGAVEPAAAEDSRPSLVSLISPLLPVLLALSAAAVQIRLGHHLDRAAWLMAFGLIALVLARQGLMVLELLAPSRDADAGLMQRLTHAALGGAAGGEGPGSGYEPL